MHYFTNIYIYKHNYISLYLEDSSNILKMSAPKTANLLFTSICIQLHIITIHVLPRIIEIIIIYIN